MEHAEPATAGAARAPRAGGQAPAPVFKAVPPALLAAMQASGRPPPKLPAAVPPRATQEASPPVNGGDRTQQGGQEAAPQGPPLDDGRAGRLLGDPQALAALQQWVEQRDGWAEAALAPTPGGTSVASEVVQYPAREQVGARGSAEGMPSRGGA